MVRCVLFLLISLIRTVTYSQDEIYLKKGVLSASATIAPSSMLNRDESNFYIHGFAEYFLGRNFSLRSDNYLLVDGRNELPFASKAYRGYFGMAYHFGEDNWDNHIGFQPRVTIMKLATNEFVFHNPTDLSASIALRVGTSYYVWKYFNFFANVHLCTL